MGLPRLLDANGSLSRFPGRNLVRQKVLVQGAVLHGLRLQIVASNLQSTTERRPNFQAFPTGVSNMENWAVLDLQITRN